MRKVFKKLIYENPLFVLLLGLCPALAVTTNFESAYIMGICFTIVIILSNVVISLFRKLIPENVQIPTFILIIGTFVTIIEILLNRFLPDLSNKLGVYLSLIVVNCIVLGRALSFASKNSVLCTLKDSSLTGIGYTLALMLIGAIREILGTNTITFMNSLSSITGFRAVYKVYPDFSLLPNPIFSSPAGAFLILGLLIALFNYLKGDRHESN